jgi:hypothetical protein
MRIIVWTFSKWLLKQVNQQRKLLSGSCRFFNVFKWMWKILNVFLDWWKKYEMMFLTIVFLTWQVFDIIGSPIEIYIFCLVEIFTNSRKCILQLGNLKKLIFVIFFWSNDLRIDCSSPFNLVDLTKQKIKNKKNL